MAGPFNTISELQTLSAERDRLLADMTAQLEIVLKQCENINAEMEVIFQLNANQHRQDIHPYTCGNNSSHRPMVACLEGWRCADCEYRQPYRQEYSKQLGE